MKCPHCNKDIKESLILQEAARIGGRRSKRKLTSEEAREMAKKSHESRKTKRWGLNRPLFISGNFPLFLVNRKNTLFTRKNHIKIPFLPAKIRKPKNTPYNVAIIF